jgi:hypothetical protein
MGVSRQRRPWRARWAHLGIAAIAASCLAVLGSATAFAQTLPPDQVIFAPGVAHTAEEGPNNIDGEEVAQFFDTGALAPCSPTDYSADINWGDQTDHSTGTITCTLQQDPDLGDVAVYSVTGSHTYADSGKFAITVTVTEPDATKTSNGDDPDTATISDAPISATSHTNLQGGGEG